MIDTREFFPQADQLESAEAAGLSKLAHGLTGSEILKIASEIRAKAAAGAKICNLTVGDFSSQQFPIPQKLEQEIEKALRNGETNYPPSDGVLDLRKEVAKFYERELGLSYPVESILIAGGSRPIIYSTYRAIVDPGDVVIYPTPSWNNNHYTYLSGAQAIELVVDESTNFQPTAEMIRPHIGKARLICINTPLNPTGTMMPKEEVTALAQLVVDENNRRKQKGERLVYVMWDHVYWMLTFGDEKHWTPPQVVPESCAYTVFVDGISKAFASTGLRVGWAVGPSFIVGRMRDIVGHVGAWAPRAEQVATAHLLGDSPAIAEYHSEMIGKLRERLEFLHAEFQRMKSEGLPVDSVAPQGAIYLSAQFHLPGKTNDQIRHLLLDEAAFAVVPFQAFGLQRDTGWFRISVGAASMDEIREGMARVESVLKR
jgi:aspartate aminotransferase